MAHGHRLTWYLTWMSDAWRPMAAFVYLFICLTDFVFMPVWYEITNNATRRIDSIVELSLKFEGGAAQVQALTVLRNERAWTPITLGESGLFHIAFGAILSAASWTRGQERIKIASNASESAAAKDFAAKVQTLSPQPPPTAQEVNVHVEQPT